MYGLIPGLNQPSSAKVVLVLLARVAISLGNGHRNPIGSLKDMHESLVYFMCYSMFLIL